MMAGCTLWEDGGIGEGEVQSRCFHNAWFVSVSTPPTPAPPSWDNAKARNPWHRFAPTQIHGNFFSISSPHWSITARLPRWIGEEVFAVADGAQSWARHTAVCCKCSGDASRPEQREASAGTYVSWFLGTYVNKQKTAGKTQTWRRKSLTPWSLLLNEAYFPLILADGCIAELSISIFWTAFP